MKRLYFYLIILVLINSCKDNSVDTSDIDSKAPEVFGYFRTADNGQLLGQVGITFNNGSWIKDTYEYNLAIPTPNPIVNETIFNFSLRKKQNITLYISPSKSLKKSSFKDFGVKNTFQFGADRIMIINSDLFDEGMHSISFDLRTLSNSNIPNGLYRLYLKTEDNYYWQDVMISK